MSLGSAFLFCFYCRKLRDQPRSTLAFSLVSSEKLCRWCVGLFSFLQKLFQEQHHQVEKKIFSLVFYSQDRHHGILDLVSYHNSSFPWENIFPASLLAVLVQKKVGVASIFSDFKLCSLRARQSLDIYVSGKAGRFGPDNYIESRSTQPPKFQKHVRMKSGLH